MRKVILTVATNKLVLLPSVVDWSGAPEIVREQVKRDRKYVVWKHKIGLETFS